MHNVQQDTLDLNTAFIEFYDSLNALLMGDLSAMEAIWSHSEDAAYRCPQGNAVSGWNRIQEVWKDQASLRKGEQVEPLNIQIVKDKHIAYIENYEVRVNSNSGTPEQTKIRAANVFRKENGVWKMVSYETYTIPHLAGSE